MDCQAVAVNRLRVLAHFTPGPRVTDFLAPLQDLIDVRFCAADDDATFYRELADADVLWHVLRPVSAEDLERGRRLKLVHKMGAGVNTIDVDAATRLGIAVANMPGAVPRTSTYALTNATLPYVLKLADKGWQAACRSDAALAKGLSTHEGQLLSREVAADLDLPLGSVDY